MKRHLFLIAGILVVIIVNALAFAQQYPKIQSLFNLESANKQYDEIVQNLNKKNGLEDLNVYLRQLENLRDDAKDCVSGAQSHLKIIDDLLKTTQFDQTAPSQHSDYNYLQNKKEFYVRELSQCRLFVYRAEELLGDYRDKLQKLSTYHLLKRNHPIWEELMNFSWGSLKQIDFQKLNETSGYNQLQFNEILIGSSLLLVALLFALYIRLLCRYWLNKVYQVHVSVRAFIAVLHSTVVPLFIFATTSTFFNVKFNTTGSNATIEFMSHAILIYILIYAASRYLFFPSGSVPNLLKFPVWFGRILHVRLMLLVSWLLLSYLVTLLLLDQSLPDPLIGLMRIFFITVFNLLTLWFCLSWFTYSKKENKFSAFMASLQVFLWVFFILAILTEWLGYHSLVLFVLKGILLTIFLSVLALGIWRIIDACYECTDDRKYRLARRVHALFGVRFNKRIFELSLIKFSAYVTVLALYVIGLMLIWDLSNKWVTNTISWLFGGIQIVNFHIIPIRFVFALLVFSIILLIGRFISATTAKRANFQGEEETQIAVSTIIIYIAFTIALIFALLTTGVDFTGLVIIAGALSVGIGLGLQGIVNNFVSGLILLLEKPIKPGDRISVSGTEGFVKKIRIRSTQIATMSKEDVIVPNADLINNKVTNYMFRDRFSRVSCQVGVAYGSDIELVRQLLLDVAQANEDVMHDAPNEPVVLFRKFGESSLDFELWCVIYDVNNKYRVVSMLNFAIDKAFRAHNISIAFPQRDLHIKDYQVIKEMKNVNLTIKE